MTTKGQKMTEGNYLLGENITIGLDTLLELAITAKLLLLVHHFPVRPVEYTKGMTKRIKRFITRLETGPSIGISQTL